MKNSYANIHKLTRVDPHKETPETFKVEEHQRLKSPPPKGPELNINKKDNVLKKDYTNLIERQRNEQVNEQTAIRERLEYLYEAHKKLKKNKVAMDHFLPANTFRKKSNGMSLKKIQDI